MSEKIGNKLETILSQIEKIYGKGSVFQYGKGIQDVVESVSTGSLKLNYATGVGGIPKGRITEIYGPESSGKTTLCLHVVAEAQKAGGICAFIDAEHALDPKYATNIGVNMESLILSQPDHGEQALDIVEKLVESKLLSVIVIDSVAALIPRSEIEGEIGDATMAVQARLMSQAMRRMIGKIKKSNTAVIFINQLRQKIGVMFGNPETTTGGNALKFYASLRLDIRKIGVVKDGEEVIANKTKVKVVKNKVAAPFKEAEFEIRYNLGIDRYNEVIDLAIEYDILKKAGAWLQLKDHKWQGRENLRAAMIKNEKLYIILRKKIIGE